MALLRAFLARVDVAHAAGHARVAGIVVDLPVAIIVLAVARLRDLAGDFDVWPDTRVIVGYASKHARVGNESANAALLWIAPADGADFHVTRQIVCSVNETVAIVVDAIAAFLNASVCRGALVFASRRIGFVEVDPTRITRENRAFRVCRRTRLARHGGRRAFRCAIEHDAVVAARAAIRRALAQVDVFIDLVVAVVVLLVARLVVVRAFDAAIVLADEVTIEVVPASGATAGCADARHARLHVPRARDVGRIEQECVAVVVARAAVRDLVEIDAVIDLAVAIVVEIIALLDAAVCLDAWSTGA